MSYPRRRRRRGAFATAKDPKDCKIAQTTATRPIVFITGAGGGVGTALRRHLSRSFQTIGADLEAPKGAKNFFKLDLTKQSSVDLAMKEFAAKFGLRIDAVVHLAAYFDFTGADTEKYHSVNEEGTRRLLKALQRFDVGRFIYSGTMLVHAAGRPGEVIDEETPIAPKWAYPQSKARAEEIIRAERGEIPITLLHIAGLYDEETAVPTLAQQIARIYERRIKSHIYSGDADAGQAFVHRDDLLNAIRRVIELREDLPENHVLMIGEREAISYRRLQDRIGGLIHGEEDWLTIIAPKPLAKFGATIEEKSEPIIPDALDRGEKPFIRPFMIDMASDHYALDIDRANELIGWRPKHSILDTLPALIAALKENPAKWYKANKITAPRWMEKAEDRNLDPERVRERHEERVKAERRMFLWAPLFNMFAATWLLTAPTLLGYQSEGLAFSDRIAGAVVLILSFISLFPKAAIIRWLIAGAGIWVMFAPLVFWTPSAAAYLNDTLVGAAIFAFAVAVPPAPGVTRIATQTGPATPPGWDFNPSAWLQRLPIIILAIAGLHISRYLTAYQLGHVDGVWEPFFSGSAGDPQNGTEEIITSSVSRAWPVPDAGIGALTYMLEILTGVIGSTRRWRTMPWLVLLFGLMIAPLGVISITFIIIQPIVIGTWCTLCLIAAAAMLIQIPYSLDELVATCEFLLRKRKAGAPVLRIFFTGDTDEGDDAEDRDEFAQSPGAIARDIVGGGLTAPWNLLVLIGIGVSLMFTRLTFGATGGMANFDHLIGALVVTTSVIAFAEAARPIRFLNIAFGAALLVTPFVYGVDAIQLAASIVAGILLIGLSFPRGAINNRYGAWSKALI